MPFEKFKKEIKNMKMEKLKLLLEDKQRQLFKNNTRAKRMSSTGKDSFPYKKIKKEIAILNYFIHKKQVEMK